MWKWSTWDIYEFLWKKYLNLLENVDNYEYNSELKRFESIM